jgi:Bucentaur or craniofacial development
MIMIKRTYTFAGKVHTEQKLVPRNSAEAKLYLSSLPDPSNPPLAPVAEEATPSPFTKPKRPVKKARRSIFEPVPLEGWPKRHDLFFGERKEESGVGLTRLVGGKEKKLNTVEKSAMDWAGFVDKEGIKDELDAAGKSKGAYKARQEFLARVERKKVEDERRARGLPVI